VIESCAPGFCDLVEAEPGCEAPERTWSRDEDRDGYADVDTSVVACESPGDDWLDCTVGADGTLVCLDDCHDRDARVNPGVETYSPTSYEREDGTRSFDWNCDGRNETEHGCGGCTAGTCPCMACPTQECAYMPGFACSTGSVPSCGVRGTFITGCGTCLLSCRLIMSGDSVAQPCR
jgi:hypothetical protein